MNENRFKQLIKKSVKAQGGFALSLSAPMVSGLPDLYVAMPGFIPVLLEAKWLAFGPTRKIPITPIQRKTLEWCNKVIFRSAFILCGYKIDKTMFATLAQYDQTHLNQPHSYEYFMQGEIQIRSLFYEASVTELNTYNYD